MVHLPFRLAKLAKTITPARRDKNVLSAKKRLTRRLFFERLEDRVVPSTLAADKAVYAPTETATLQLSGFQVGETVALQVVQVDSDTGLAHTSPRWLAVDGGPGDFDGTANGQLTVPFTVPADIRLDSFHITATGQSSGSTAQTTIWGDSSHLLEDEADASAPPATTTTVSSSALPASPGQPVTFTAVVTSTSTVDTGTVQFLVDGFNLGDPVPVVNGTATSNAITTLTASNHTVTAVYNDDTGSFDSSNGTLVQTSDETANLGAATSVVVAASPKTELDDDQSVTFMATVSSASPIDRGTVQFYVDGEVFGDPVPVVDGSATSDEVTDLGPGEHVIAANYSDDTGVFQSSGGILAFGVAWVDVRPKDVAPGQVVSILAGGFQVGETVDFQIKNLTTGEMYAPFSVADGGATDLDGTADGNVQTGWTVPADALASKLQISATGESSGQSADNTFTDALNTTTTITSSQNPSGQNKSVTFTANVTSPTAATVGVNFNGINSVNSNGTGSTCNCQPPDTIVAAGPSNVIEAVNTAIKVSDKLGNQQSFQSLSTFFSGHGFTVNNLTDPFVLYDENISNGAGNPGGRFIVGMLDFTASNAVDNLDLAVSNDWDATHGFTEVHQVNVGNDGSGNFFADYPRVGFNADALIVTFNMFSLTAGTFQHAQVWTASLSSLTDANNSTFTTFHSVAPTSPLYFSMDPAVMHNPPSGNPATDPAYLVVRGTTTPSTNVFVIKMTNVLSNTPTLTSTSVTVPSYSNAVGATQPGAGGLFPATGQIDFRMLNAAWRNNILVADQTIRLGTTGSFDQARWYQFDTSGATPALAMSGNIAPGTGISTMYPSIDIDANNNLGMTYMELSSTEFISMYVTGRQASDAAGTMGTGVLVAAGNATYSTGTNRGGDFSGTSIDPSTGTTFWSANEYSNSSVSVFWSTQVTSFTIGQAAIVNTGSILLQDGGATLASIPVSSGAATFSTSSLPAGSHIITATYTDGSTFNSSFATMLQTVNGTNTAVNSSQNPSTYGQSTSFTANVTQPLATATAVAGYNGLLSSDSNPTAINGTGSCNCQPPDTIVAAGPSNVVEMVNTAIEWRTKTGTLITRQKLGGATGGFFSSLGLGSNSVTDPFVLYDENISNGAGNPSGRFIVGMLDFSSQTATDFLDVAVSNDWDATHGFTEMHRVNVGAEGTSNGFADYPRAGFNADGFFVTFNMFALTTGQPYQHVQVFAMQLASLIDASNTTFVTNHFDEPDSNLFTLAPAAMHGAPADGKMYFVTESDTPAFEINVVKLTNYFGTPTFADNNIPVASYAEPIPAPQSGGTYSPQIDSRVLNAAWRNNILVADHTVFDAGADHARWYQFNTTCAPTLTMEGDVAPGSGVYTIYPAIDIDANNNLGLTYMEMSSSEFVSMYVTGRTPSDPVGTMAPGVRVAAGATTSTQTRGGDFAGMSVDPSTGTSFWGANEFFNNSVSTNWATFVSNFTVSAGTTSVGNTGSVQFQIDGVNFGSPVSVSGGSANSGPTTTIPGGGHTITANYTDGPTLGDSSGSLLQTVNAANTSTTVTSSLNPSTYGQSVAFAATVTNASTSAAPTGSLEFFDGSTDLGAGTLGASSGNQTTWTFGISTLSAGSHAIQAVFSDAANFNGSSGTLAQTVNKANASITVTPYGVTYDGNSHTATGSATGVFNESLAGLDRSGTTHTNAGSYTDTWTFTDVTGNYNNATGTVTDSIAAASTSTAISSSVNPSVFGQPISFVAAVSNASGTGVTPTGNVQFAIDGSNLDGLVSLDVTGHATSIVTSTLTAGTHTVTATYSNIDGNFSNSNGTLAGGQVVNAASTNTTVASSANPSIYGNSVRFTFTVTANSPSTATVNTGTVTVLDGTNTLGTASVSATGTATFSTAQLTAGAHTITGNYADGASFGSSSASLIQTVNLRTLLITANSGSKTEGNNLTFAANAFTTAGTVNTAGLVNGNTVTSVALTSGGAASTAEDGSYAITPSSAVGSGLSNYAITYVPGTLTVLEPSIAVTSTPLGAINEGDPSAPVEVATFTHASGVEAATHFSATVNWGVAGHTADPGTISEDGAGTYHVTAARPVLNEQGTYTAVVTVKDADAGASIAQNFSGLNTFDDAALNGGGFFVPPDQGSAVGPNHYMEIVNLIYAIYNKDGTTAVPRTPLSTLFANAGIPGLGNNLSDPRLIYDQASARWFTVAISTGANSNNVVLAVSQTSDPTGAWKAASFTANTTPNNFADYPTIAVDQNALYISHNNFLNDATFDGVSLTTIPKADLLKVAGPDVSHRSHFENITGGGTAGTTPFTFAPVSAFDGRDHGVIIATDGISPATVLHRYSVLNSGSTSSTLTSDSPITVPSYWNDQNAHQPDGSRTLNDGDFRIGTNNVYQVGNVVWLADSVLTSSATGNAAYDAVRWYEIDETTNTLLQSGTISDPHHDFLYPAIAASASGNVIIGFTVTGDSTTTDFAGSWYVAGTTTGGVTTFGAPQPLKNGSSNYSIVASGRNRWGDFSAISVDPNNPNAFWIAEETAIPGVTTLNALWGTQISELTFGNSASASNTLTVNEPPINGASALLPAIQAGQAGITLEVASFTHANGVEPAGDFTATVNWGIAGHTADIGAVTQDGSGTYHVSALRPVFNAGTYPVAVSISEDNASTTVTDSQEVDKASTTTAVTTSVNPSTYGQAVSFTATVSPVAPGAGTPTGTVQFVIDGVNFGSPVTLVNGTATSGSISTLFAGTHTVTTVYSGDSNFTSGTNGSTSLIVTRDSTTTTASVSPGSANFGQSITFSAVVSANAPGSGTPTGSVDFFDSTTHVDLGPAPLVNGHATISTSTLPVGANTITVSYGGDPNFLSSSTSITVSIGSAAYILNPTVGGALSLSGNASVQVQGLVMVDSSSATALSGSGQAQLTAGSIRIVGGYSWSSSVALNPHPVTGVAPAADPLAGLPVPTGGASLGPVALNSGSRTISPGVYTQISLSSSASLILKPGVYVIAGGGISVSGSASITVASGFDSVTGHGVMIYNAGSSYPSLGGNFGGVSLSGQGTIALSAPDQGTYAGISLFQERDNPRAVSLSGQGVALLKTGLIYAKGALLTVSGQAQLQDALIVDRFQVSGNGSSSVSVDGGTTTASGVAGELLGGDLYVYVNDPQGYFTTDAAARLNDAITGLDALLAPFSVTITEVSTPDIANVVLDNGTTTAIGGAADGVLGLFTSHATDSGVAEITLVRGWNWYTGADPSGVQPGQYDFQSIVTHELGHALGLGHNPNPGSVMYYTLADGVSRRTMTTADLNIGDVDGQPDALHAAGSALVQMSVAVGTPSGGESTPAFVGGIDLQSVEPLTFQNARSTAPSVIGVLAPAPLAAITTVSYQIENTLPAVAILEDPVGDPVTRGGIEPVDFSPRRSFELITTGAQPDAVWRSEPGIESNSPSLRGAPASAYEADDSSLPLLDSTAAAARDSVFAYFSEDDVLSERSESHSLLAKPREDSSAMLAALALVLSGHRTVINGSNGRLRRPIGQPQRQRDRGPLSR
jgi:hypothetical protein